MIKDGTERQTWQSLNNRNIARALCWHRCLCLWPTFHFSKQEKVLLWLIVRLFCGSVWLLLSPCRLSRKKFQHVMQDWSTTCIWHSTARVTSTMRALRLMEGPSRAQASISQGLTIGRTGQNDVAQQQSRSELLEEGESMFRPSPSGSIWPIHNKHGLKSFPVLCHAP